MGDQGSLESRRGVDNNTTAARRLSEAITNAREDQSKEGTKQNDSSSAEGNESGLGKAGPRSTPPNNGLNRQSSHRSTSGSPPPTRRLEVPVTKTTLSELDVTKIVHNPKLRHDINFDPELHFRPNLDGEKGQRKQHKANHFWDTLRDQLEQFITDRDGFIREYGNGEDWCLPMLLKSVKDIIHTLVPTRDRVCLDEGLNVGLIMQQFSRGMADLEKLASWLSSVLKSHCAPMRDEWVDQMYNQLTNGNRTNNMSELVQGLRNLLSVLEAMKLDVANHQIRCLRPILIEDTVHFEQKFFSKKIEDCKLDPTPAYLWYSELNQAEDPASLHAFGDMATFFEELVNMVMPSYTASNPVLPCTFIFDEERLTKLRSDMLDAINLDICMSLYENWQDFEEFREFCGTTIPSPYLVTPLSDGAGYMSSQLMDDDGEFDFHSRPSSMTFSAAGSAHSSPRSSMVIQSGLNSSSAFAPQSAEETRLKSKSMHKSLVALLQGSNTPARGATRWTTLKDSLAIQIFRFTNLPIDMLPYFENAVYHHMGDISSPNVPAVYSPRYLRAEQSFRQRLLTELQLRVKDLKGLHGISLYSTATGGRLQVGGRTSDGWRDADHDPREEIPAEPREEGSLNDMATRLAHLGLLHWRVWARLGVYVNDLDTNTIDSDITMAT
ncbi:camp-mediated signaling protein Sok1 [Xylariaceae sp. FL1272]|nr:camp-mediated signaling protein Sok1 [Xylariaceae sp. FL1272]